MGQGLSIHRAELAAQLVTCDSVLRLSAGDPQGDQDRSSFPTDEAVTRLFYLALNNISKNWSMPIRDWKAALNRFTIQFEDRLMPH
jgi:hypothetical protein